MNSMRRQLNEDEKKISQKSIDRLQRRNKEIDYHTRKTKLELEIGLDLAYQQTKEDYSKVIKEWDIELKSNIQQIGILTDHITIGVEAKKDVKYTG